VACLCDFGLSHVFEVTSPSCILTTQGNGTTRWKSPELLNGDQLTVTTQSDMYAFGMTCLVS
jgi:serine/threonine protein kinase